MSLAASPASHRTLPSRSIAELTRLALAAGLTVLVMFLLWEVIERQFATETRTAYLMHYARGISSSLMTAAVVSWVFYNQSRRRVGALEAEVEQRTHDLQDARALLQLVFDTTPASLIVLDPDYRIVTANREAERLHGRALGGDVCYKLLANRDHRCDGCPAETTFTTGLSGRVDGEHADHRTGEILAVECHRLKRPDGRDYVLLVEQSVTEQRKLEARVLHQEKMAAFGLLAAGVAHDMGNPLSSIGAQLQLLDDVALPDEIRAVVTTVGEETQRLRRILRELVDFARRRRDEASLVSVQGVVDDALRLVRHDRRMRKVEIEEEFDAETPPVFLVEDHLMQVVMNLVLNALDAMPQGGRLRLAIRPSGDSVVLRVHDAGHGMDRAVLERCFEPLYTTKDPGKGTGLGLSICRDIITAAGGRIELHSAPRQGTTALVVLPAADIDAARSETAAAPAPSLAGSP